MLNSESKPDFSNVMKEGKHCPSEYIWLDLQPWLKSCGYTLRDRYQPDWTAWLKPGPERHWPELAHTRRSSNFLIDDLTWETFLQFSHLLDASREDGSFVMLKRIDVSRHPDEVEIGDSFVRNRSF